MSQPSIPAVEKPVYNNAAGRLLAILKAAKAANGNFRVDVIFSNVLGTLKGAHGELHPEQQSKLLHALSLAHLQIDAIERWIGEAFAPNDPRLELYLRPLYLVRQAFTPDQLSNTWSNWATKINDVVLVGVEHCAAAMPSEPEIAASDIDRIQQEVNSLFKMVSGSKSIKPELRRWILQLLAEIEKSLRAFSICGVSGFRNSLRTIIAEFVARHTEERESSQSRSEEERDILDRLYQLTVSLADAVNTFDDKWGNLLRYAHGVALLTVDKAPFLIEQASRATQ